MSTTTRLLEEIESESRSAWRLLNIWRRNRNAVAALEWLDDRPWLTTDRRYWEHEARDTHSYLRYLLYLRQIALGRAG